MLALVLALLGALQAPVAPPQDLVRALETLRHGASGEPGFDEALRRLPEVIRSSTSWIVAGGAYLAAEHDRPSCVPALFEALQPGSRLDHHAVGNVLDALIRLGAHVEPRIVDLIEGHDSELFLLLVRDAPGNRAGLLALFDRGGDRDRARLAAAAILVGLRDEEVAERLIARIPWEVDVTVRLSGSTVVAGGGGGGSKGWTCSHPTWPPRVVHELILPGPDDAVDAVHYQRKQDTRSLRWNSFVTSAQRAALRARLLDELLGEGARPERLRASDDLIVDWSEASAFERALREHVQDLRARIRATASALTERGLLAQPEEVLRRVELHVRLHDVRGDGYLFLTRPDLGADVDYVD